MRTALLLLVMIGLLSCQEVEQAGPEVAGIYALQSWKGVKPDGTEVYPYGEASRGQLIYSGDGQMSMQLVGDDRPQLGTDDYALLDSLTILQAYKSFFSYYGTYEVDEEAQRITHVIAGCKNPDWKGRRLFRKYAWEAEELIILSDSVIGMDHVLRWKRVE